MIDFENLNLSKDGTLWISPYVKGEIQVEIPGNKEGADLTLLNLAKELEKEIEKYKADATQFLLNFCKHVDDPWLDGLTLLRPDQDEWGADFILDFSLEDSLMAYVGFRKGFEHYHPFYVLQRVE